jgi:hypothetical protein
VQTDAVGDDRGLALVGNCLPVDQRERPQRRHRFVKPVAFEHTGERLAEFLAALREQKQRDRLRREQRGVHDQRLGGGVELCGFVDGERERLRHREAVVVLGRGVAGIVEEFGGGCGEAFRVFGKRQIEPLAIGRRLLVRERQPVERFGQSERGGALGRAAGAGDEIIGANFLWPQPDLDRRRHAAPGMRVRGDQHARHAAARQIGLERVGIDGVVVDQQNALALVHKPLHYGLERRLLLLVGRHPVEPHAQRHEIGAHAVRGLRPDPPGGAVVAAVALGIGRRKRGLAHAAQPVQRGDGDAAAVAGERGIDGRQRVVAAEEMLGYADRDVGDGEHRAREGGGRGRLALRHEFAKTDAGCVLRHAVELATADVV